MKNVLFLVLLSIILAGCKKNSVDPNNNSENSNNSNQNSNNSAGVIIKGTISASSLSKRTLTNVTDTVSLSDAKKVLVFNGNSYNLFEIVNGSFTASATMGTATALAFLDTNNTYIGNLCTGGLNVLPLVSLKDGENTTIDLSTLTMTGDNVVANHNPLGDEIGITNAEINCLKEVSGYYESLAKNIDADNDGIPDVLTNTQINISTIFAISVGTWGRNSAPALWTDTTNYYFNYMLSLAGGTGLTFSNGNISLSGPAESPYTDIALHGSMINPSSNTGFLATFKREVAAPLSAPWGSTFLPFKKGIYTVTLDGSRSYTLNYSNLNMKYNLVFVIPTAHTDSTGKLTSLTFEYKLPNGTPVNPANLLTDVMIQLFDINHNVIFGNYQDRLTSKTSFTSYTFSTPLDISTLWQMDVWYDDILGNQYDIIWH
jgi:hypothetical protein